MHEAHLENGCGRSKPLTGKIALVTGGTRGIGKAVTQALVSQGAKVAITYSRSKDTASKIVEDLGAENVVAFQSDAGSMKDIEALVRTMVKEFEHIDILIANAALSPAESLQHTSESTFDLVMATNVKGPFFLAQKAAPFMPSHSKIIFVSSSLCNTSQVMAEKLLYCTSKGAVEQMTRVMAKDLGRRHIAVNCVAPGPTATEMFYEGKSEELIRIISGFSPYGRIGTSEETAAVFMFLCGRDSSWVTGQVLRVNGGSA